MTPNQADRDAAIAFVDALGFPQYAMLFDPKLILPDAGAHRAMAVLAAHRRAALEEAARVVEEELENRRAEQKRDLFDNFTRGQINTALRLHQAIRALIDKEPP